MQCAPSLARADQRQVRPQERQEQVQEKQRLLMTMKMQPLKMMQVPHRR
jgi:hypothetical protein